MNHEMREVCMKNARRFVAAVAVSSLLGVGLAFGAATTTVYAAGSDSARATSVGRFCDALATYIERLKSLPETRLRAFLIDVAEAVQAHHCGG